MIEFVSHAYDCPRADRELGEDFKTAIETFDGAFRNLLSAAMIARHGVNHEDSKAAFAEIEQALSELHHNVSWASLVDRARDAAARAKVVPMFKSVDRATLTLVKS